MDERTRRDEHARNGSRTASNGHGTDRDDEQRDDQRDDSTHGRHDGRLRPALTKREREERWPIG
jgi:hypothetical protein